MNTQCNMGKKGHWIIMFTHHSSFDCSSYNTTIQLEFPRTLRTSKKCGQICASGRFVMRINAVLYHQYATVFLTLVCNHLKFLIFVETFYESDQVRQVSPLNSKIFLTCVRTKRNKKVDD